MKVRGKTWLITFLGLCRALAQTTSDQAAKLQDLSLVDQHGDLKVQVVVIPPVKPSIVVLHNPERIILRLPRTIDSRQGRGKISVNRDGVRGLQAVPSPKDASATDVVIELAYPRSYAFGFENGECALTFTHSPEKRKPGASSGPPPAATRGPLAAIFHPRRQSRQTDKSPESVPLTSATGGFGQEEPTAIADAASSAPRSPVGETAAEQNGAPPVPDSSLSSATVGHPSTATMQPDAATPSQESPPVKSSQTEAAAQQTPSGLHRELAADLSLGPAPATQAGPEVVDDHTREITPSPSNTLPQASTAAPDAGREIPQTARPNKPALSIRAADPSLRTVFRVKYVAEGVAYLEGGRSSGLKEGVKLEILESELPVREGSSASASDPRVVAELEVSAVAETSAVTDIQAAKRPVRAGDLAYLSSDDSQALVEETALSPTRKYPAVISFSLDDPQDEEARQEVPRPPLPSVNRVRGRIGLDYMVTVGHGANAIVGSGYGMMFRGDLTRIHGTYWNLSGYWRGRFSSESPASGQTLQDLINRTYHLSLTYENPNSPWVAGFGRLYLPWATSLDTIDGGYFGRRISGIATLGIFGGSTPDPTSYDYSPNRQIAGTFLNFTGGDFAGLHFSSTIGSGASFLNWKLDRPFGFVENTVFYTQRVSVYDALQVDSPAGNPVVPAPGVGLSRNFFTLRVQPLSRLELDLNETYFRDIPTFDPALLGTGLLDKYLFQGFSGGIRAQAIKDVWIYGQLGRSSRTGDTSGSLNQLYGVSFARLPWYHLRADVHYAEFNSAFGSGSYKAASISRNLNDDLIVEVLGGTQSFNSTLTNQDHSWFLTSRVESNLGSHYFVQGNYTINRGQMSYDQSMVTVGFRFDSKGRKQ